MEQMQANPVTNPDLKTIKKSKRAYHVRKSYFKRTHVIVMALSIIAYIWLNIAMFAIGMQFTIAENENAAYVVGTGEFSLLDVISVILIISVNFMLYIENRIK